MQSIDLTAQKKIYRLISAQSDKMIKSQMSPCVYDKGNNEFQTGVFTHLFFALSRLIANRFLVCGMPKYRLYATRVKSSDKDVSRMEFRLGLHPDYLKGTSKFLCDMDSKELVSLAVQIPKYLNYVYINSGKSNVMEFKDLNTVSDYESLIETCLYSFFKNSTKVTSCN